MSLNQDATKTYQTPFIEQKLVFQKGDKILQTDWSKGLRIFFRILVGIPMSQTVKKTCFQ